MRDINTQVSSGREVSLAGSWQMRVDPEGRGWGPRLSAEPGRSHLDQTSLDAAIPGMGVWFPEKQTGFLLLTPQSNIHGAYGLEVIESAERNCAELLLLAPGFLHPLPDESGTDATTAGLAAIHLHPENGRPADVAAGDEITMEFEWHEFTSPDIHGFFDRIFSHRKSLFPATSQPAPEVIPFSAAWDILHSKHNTENWNERHGLYQVGLPWMANQPTQFWQNAWLGGGIPTLAT